MGDPVICAVAPQDSALGKMRALTKTCLSDSRTKRRVNRNSTARYGVRLALALCFSCSALSLCIAKEVEEPAPFNYNPLLDTPPSTPASERKVEWTKSASGFRVGSFVGLSFGSAASYLSPRISSLDVGTFPLFGLSLGMRLGAGEIEGVLRRFELSLSGALGFGRTYERGDYDDALDIHLRPALTLHLLETLTWDLSTQLGAQVIAFDSESGEVSQIAFGSYIGPRITWKMSEIAHVYLEFGWAYLYDFLAYSFREPTEDELLDNPAIIEIKEKGEWFNHYQISGGLQLLGF